MIRNAKRAAIAILLLLLVFCGFLQYRQYVSYKGTLHKDADLIIKINSDQLLKKLALDAIVHPSYYFKSDGSDTLAVDEDEKSGRGIDIPANFFIYSIKNNPKTFYTSLDVEDSTELKTFLKDVFDIENFDHQEGYNYGSALEGKLQILYTEKNVAIAYSFDKKQVADILKVILIGRETLTSEDTKVSTLRNSNGDIVVVNEDNLIELNFNNGEIDLTGSLSLPGNYVLPSQALVANVDTSSSVHLRIAGPVPSAYQKKYSIHDINIPLDSLASYYHNYLDFRINGQTTQQDTIITYEYNDDFEKVETKTIQKKNVPGITILAKGDPFHINRLLQKENIVIDDKINRKILALYELGVREKQPSDIIFSNTLNVPQLELAHSVNFMNLYVNFVKLKKEENSPFSGQIFENFNRLYISASKQDSRVNLQGRLLLNGDNINALLLLKN